jgi:hypothetical protein
MKSIKLVLLLMITLSLAALSSGQSIDEPRFVNSFLDDFETPVITPGNSGTFSLTINNPDPVNLTQDMQNVRLNVSIYQYATLEESLMIWEISEPPVIFESNDIKYMVETSDISPGGQVPVSFTISVDRDTPHGSPFSQSTYLLRFWLEFEYDGVNYAFASKGHLTDEQWSHLTESEGGAGSVNQTYLMGLGLDGIIPDSSFTAKPYAGRPLPLWPFYLLVIITVFIGLLAVCYYSLDNPGTFPRLERQVLRINGCFIKLKRTLFSRKRA